MKIFYRISIILAFILSGCNDKPATILEITLQNHRFTPQEIVAYEGEKIKLKINNLDDSTEEFDSTDLNREKLIFASNLKQPNCLYYISH
jgi:hypothetical protein